MMLLFILPCLVLGITIHELGHAFAALVVGSRVKEISIGQGEPFATFCIGGCRIHLRPILLGGGLCSTIPRKERYFRMRMFVVLIAGVLAEVVALIVLRSMVDTGSLVAGSFVRAFALVTLLSLVLNLRPSVKNGQPTDGKQILDLFSMLDEEVRWIVGEADASDFLTDALDLARTGQVGDSLAVVAPYVEEHSGSALAHLVHSESLTDLTRYPEALAAARRSLAIIDGDRSVQRRFRYSAENSTAYVMSLIGDPQHLLEARRLAERAHRELDMPATAGTLGSILVQAGEPDDGLRLLERSRHDVLSPLALFETERFVMIGHLAELDMDAARGAFARGTDIPEVPSHRLENMAANLGAAEAVLWLRVFAEGLAPDVSGLAGSAEIIGAALSAWLSIDDEERWILFERSNGDRGSVTDSSLEALGQLASILAGGAFGPESECISNRIEH